MGDSARIVGKPLLLMEAVISESWFFLNSASLRRRLQELTEEIPLFPWAPKDPGGHRTEVFAWLERYLEHGPDWADASIIVACASLKGSRVWTYDSEFRKVWRMPSGAAVPLVP